MSFLSVPDTVEFIINGDCGGKAVANVMGAKRAGYVQADLDSLAAVVDGWVASDYIPLFNNAVNYVETHVRGLNAIIDLESVNGTSAGPGTASGTGMPANASFVITLRSGFTGRSARGRFYMWPYSTADLVSVQTVSSTYANAAAAAITNLLGLVAATGFIPVIISRRTGGAPRLVGHTTNIISATARNLNVDSMRHRLTKGH